MLIDGIAAEALRVGDLPADIALSPQALTIGPWTLSLGMHTSVLAEGVLAGGGRAVRTAC